MEFEETQVAARVGALELLSTIAILSVPTFTNESARASEKHSDSIPFSMASPAAINGLKSRDEAMTWQCIGRSMFDCDGEREKKAEEAGEEFRKAFIKN